MENRFSQITTTIWQKTALVLLGLFLSLVLLEVGMRLGGFVLLSVQEYGNLQSIKQKGAYRILCLGESTTVGQYPHLLEEVLNQRHIGVRFSVVDKGIPGTNTSAILNQVESYLAEYHPDMVVAMMGINDSGKHMPLEVPTISEGRLFIRSLRTYKLARLLWLHILTKAREMRGSKPDKEKRNSEKAQTSVPETGRKETSAENISTEGSLKKAIEINPKNDRAYVELGRLYRDQGKVAQAGDSFKKAIEINPKSYDAYVGLGWLHQTHGKLAQAGDSFKKAIEINPKSEHAYVGLGRLYRDQGKLAQAVDSFKKTIELNPKNNRAYVELGRLYRDQGKVAQAEDSFKKAIELNPIIDHAHVELGGLYQAQGKLAQAVDSFKKTIELNPKNDRAYVELGWLYRAQGKLAQAEDFFKKALVTFPQDERILGAMALLYEEMGKQDLAKEYAEKVNKLRSRNCPAIAVNNYRELKEILDGKRIKLVCVQYPVRNIEPLKQIFEKDGDVIFVDNERVFKKVVREEGYKEYFRDMFGGDFGHCTQKGDMLLAKNIAAVILREVFNKR